MKWRKENNENNEAKSKINRHRERKAGSVMVAKAKMIENGSIISGNIES
jgi:hypothetical protein